MFQTVSIKYFLWTSTNELAQVLFNGNLLEEMQDMHQIIFLVFIR